MDRLLEGYRRFRADIWPGERQRYETLSVEGQKPHTLVIGCSDSRVDPQRVFGAAPGELFVVRNVAALAPPYQPDSHYHGASAALEFGVRVLGVRQIVVLGHGQCGGVQAMLEGAPDQAKDFVEPWLTIARPALERLPDGLAPEQRLARCEAEVIRLTLDNLLTFPWIAERVADGRLKLHGYQFAIHDGVLKRLDGDALVPVE